MASRTKWEKGHLDVGKLPAGNRGWRWGGGGCFREWQVIQCHWYSGHTGSRDAEGRASNLSRAQAFLSRPQRFGFWRNVGAMKDFKQGSESSWSSVSEVIFVGCWLCSRIKCTKCLQNISSPASLWKCI